MRFAAKFFKQEASWEALTTANAYDGSSFEDAETIDVRWFTETVRVESDRGVVTTAKTFISTLVEVGVGDRVTDEDGVSRIVESVRKNRSTGGTVSHYVAALQ